MAWDLAGLQQEREALAEAAVAGESTAVLERHLRAVALAEGYVDGCRQLDSAADPTEAAVKMLATCRGRSSIGLARTEGYRSAVLDRLRDEGRPA